MLALNLADEAAVLAGLRVADDTVLRHTARQDRRAMRAARVVS